MRSVIFFVSLAMVARASPCHYSSWSWDTVHKKTTQEREIVKDTSHLTVEEKGSTPGCSVCHEDQVEVDISGLPKFEICRSLESQVRKALSSALKSGFPIHSLVGYRVGRSKGDLDSQGLRTEFSHHSYGTALDINSESNGLYDRCFHFGPQCRRLRGGEYQPGARYSITKDSPVYRAMKSEGFLWGGELPGKQKDFMHFSLDGS